jgi:hypothetical protein
MRRCTSSFGEEIGNAFDLGNAVVHNHARIFGSRPVVVHIDSPQWSYAAAFRLPANALNQCTGGDSLVMRVSLTVKRGRIGALFVADDLETVLSTADERSSAEELSREEGGIGLWSESDCDVNRFQPASYAA